jgi:sulfite reductase alpha subunit-like flavoprotein
VLDAASARSQLVGHENDGFLSEEWGFLPRRAPALSLPPAFAVWDSAAAQLPGLWRDQRVRRVLDALPLLSGDEAALPDHALHRAATVLGLLSHAYVRAERPAGERLPDALRAPWETVSRRLGRRQPILAYADLILYNWRPRGPASERRVEEMQLLVPTVGNAAEHIFYLTQVEIHATCAPVIGATVRAQEAALRGDSIAVEAELWRMLDALQQATHVSLQKIDPNARGRTYVDSVVWAKTVAPLAVPIDAGVQGPSGTSAPIFHLLDAFLGRSSFDTLLGHEAANLRAWFPRNWVALLDAVASVSVADFVQRSSSRQLTGAFRSLLDGYAGDHGLLAAHRLKVYGYIETAFKMGRSITIGGFEGQFRDREWERVDAALNSARAERCADVFVEPVRAQVLLTRPRRGGVAHVRLDATGAGLHYRPGDHCAVMPENDPALVARTLRAMRAGGDEPIRLDRTWQAAIRARLGEDAPAALPLAALLRYGTLRPVRRSVAQALVRLTGIAVLERIVEARAEDQWELWDLLDLLAEHGFDPRRLWRAESWEADSVCRLVPPEQERYYSIASAGELGPTQLDLLVGQLTYTTESSHTTRAATRHGVGSSYLRRLAGSGGTATIRTVPAPGFHLPRDPRSPIVLIAGGSGIAPFLGFIQARSRLGHAAPAWLMYAVRHRADMVPSPLLEQLADSGWLRLDVITSREGRRQRIGDFLRDPRVQTDLWAQLRSRAEGGDEAYVYVCGRGEFAAEAFDGLRELARAALTHAQAGDEWLYRLVADERYAQDVFTTYAGAYSASQRSFDASEIVLRNNDEHGWWLVIDGRVYDVSTFVHLHPGGDRILRAYCGSDASHAYRAVLHHARPDIEALRGQYQIGVVRRLFFDARWTVMIAANGLEHLSLADWFTAWVRYLYLVVQMENALRLDWSVLRKSLTADEPCDDLTAYKVDLGADVHDRFLAIHLGGTTGSDLQFLWSATLGFCAPQLRYLELSERLKDIDACADAEAVKRASSWVRSQFGLLTPERAWSVMELLRAHDEAYLHELKLLAARATRQFELHESETPTNGGTVLVEVLRAIPDLVERYYRHLAAALRDLGLTATEPLAVATAPGRCTTPQLLPDGWEDLAPHAVEGAQDAAVDEVGQQHG